MSNSPCKIVCFIPARAESTRFPGKPLADIHGKPMIVRVIEKALKSVVLNGVYVATDSEEILKSAEAFGCKAVLTSKDHKSGTDRIAQAARDLGLHGDDIVVNVQGDQPLFEPQMIDEVIAPLVADASIPMSTLIYRIIRDEEIHHPNAVKTVVDTNGFALYFSRATIPFYRNSSITQVYYKHHGIYAYRNNFLQVFAQLPLGFFERSEGLEQLRALEHGFRIKVVVTDKDSIEVDTPEDLERVRETYGKMI
ncbi:MAG: 3-deoxy-manno-octulosonate cytidylyltransferase [Desulfomonile tiedjei]|uniref:3-deoxy-manno-octulosonate cytidylyltransferase n=1 Tax=Desulfomonile tiedjei TaxID=2358 RepID=A0A9D6Z334_9BACT|nr:3-deoxy-manno-octulosonate cytidylyltransferase [Desulfomonile tiedjei]